MTQVREREDLHTGIGHDTMTESTSRVAPAPSADEVRALVEGPQQRRQVRWLRWLGVFAALALAGGIAFLAMRDDGTTTQPEIAAGDFWVVSVDSPQFEALAVEIPAFLPDNGYLMITQTPHGVSYDFVVVTQTPHGVSFDAFVPAPYGGNLTQLPEGATAAGTAYENIEFPAIVQTPYTGNPTQLPAGSSVDGTVWADL